MSYPSIEDKYRNTATALIKMRMCMQFWAFAVCINTNDPFCIIVLSMVILSCPLIEEGHLSVSGERMCISTG